jgi:glycosyltransferase involved in cell wall biosynthesis
MDYKPDVVHAHDWLTFEAGVLAKRNFGLPLVAHVHATEFDRAGMHTGNPLIHEIEYEGLMMADKIIAVSEATKRIIHDKYGIPLLGQIPIVQSIREGGDSGEPAALSSRPDGLAFVTLAEKLAETLK